MHSDQSHWENIYQTKSPEQVSWTQTTLRTLPLILEYGIKTQSIIDIGGGDSSLVDELLNSGFQDISLLDISAAAIEKSKKRLGIRSESVEWINSSMLDLPANRTYDIWHDRAAFHFLTRPEDIDKYVQIVSSQVNDILILATFSAEGPLKCSGLEIRQYSKDDLVHLFGKDFDLITAFTEDHRTPFDSLQNFQFVVFKKRKAAVTL